MSREWVGGGFLGQIILAFIFTILSKFLIGYSLGVWFGAETVARWDQVNVAVQYLVAFAASSVMVPVGVVSFFAQLIAETPIL